MRMIAVSVVAWLVGLATYEGWLRIGWGQSMGREWPAVAFWSALAFAVTGVIVYWPAMTLLRRVLGGYRPVVCFPLLAAALGLVPTALISFHWSGGMRGLLSPESSLFYVMFTAVGVVFGLGYALERQPPRKPPVQPNGPAGD